MSHLPQLEHDLAALADLMAQSADAKTAAETRPAERPSRAVAAEAAPSHVAPRRRLRARRRPALARTLAVFGLFAVVGGAVASITTGRTGTLSLVEEARAALEPDGGILHVVTVIDAANYVDGKRLRRAGNEHPGGERAEVWIASDPPRWRSVFHPDARTVAATPDRTPVRLAQVAYGHGARSTLTRDGRLYVVTGYSDRGKAAEPVTLGAFSGGLPGSGKGSLEGLRTALSAGQLRSNGQATINGKRTLRLSGTAQAAPGGTITYFVDPATFTPVRVAVRWKPTKRMTKGMRSVEVELVTDFEVFERLPTTPENDRLLTIQPPPGTKVDRKTLEEAQREMRASSPRPIRAKP